MITRQRLGPIAGFIAQQIARRSPRGRPPLRVSPRRLYILPTRFGGVFAVLLIGLLVAATNYGNNLAFALAFWLGAIALVSMHRAHRNLAGLTLTSLHTPSCHAGAWLHVSSVWATEARRARRSVAISLGDGPAQTLDIHEQTPVTLHLVTEHRGPCRLPSVRLESRYPLGLFRCWTRLAPEYVAWVYPRLASAAASIEPEGAPGAATALGARHRLGPASDEFLAHRRYRPGDALARIDWKHSARGPGWLVREFEPPGRTPEAVFDYHALAGLSHEMRLSWLARQVVEAHRRERAFTLVLPDRRIGPARGPAHRLACLDALARLP